MIVFEAEDILKSSFALVAGLIVGLEREMKDKAAGVKTITIICLGACLFAILSERMGGPGNTTALAAYIVSGVGFIGAGTIFKEGGTISGLTTAGIIWLSAAVGTAIGFAQYSAAIIFIAASLVAIVSIWLFEKYFITIRQKKKYRFVIAVPAAEQLDQLVAEIEQRQQVQVLIKQFRKTDAGITATCESIMDIATIEQFALWALSNGAVKELDM